MFFAEHTRQTNSICLPHALEGIGEQAGTRDRPHETSEKRERGRMGTSVELLFPSLPSSLLFSLNPRNRFNRFAQVENSSVQKFVRTRLNGVEGTRAVSRAAFTRVSFFRIVPCPPFLLATVSFLELLLHHVSTQALLVVLWDVKEDAWLFPTRNTADYNYLKNLKGEGAHESWGPRAGV